MWILNGCRSFAKQTDVEDAFRVNCMKAQSAWQRYHEKERELKFLRLLHEMASLKALRAMCKEIGLPVAPDTAADKREWRLKMRRLRSFVPLAHQHKIPMLLKAAAKDIVAGKLPFRHGGRKDST